MMLQPHSHPEDADTTSSTQYQPLPPVESLGGDITAAEDELTEMWQFDEQVCLR